MKILNELSESLRIAFVSIAANKMRSLLTTLGIVIGICSVVLMSTAIKGIDKSFQEGISSLGADNIYIDKWEWFSNVEWWKIRNRKNLDMSHFRAFKEQAKLPEAIAPSIWTIQNLKRGDKIIKANLIAGTNSDYVRTTNFSFKEGRFFSEFESESSREVAVLGNDVADFLFPNESAYGKTVKIGGVNFIVVGVLEKVGSSLMGDFNPDKQVFIPIGVVFKRFHTQRIRSITIIVKAPSPAMLEAVKEEAEAIMRKIRKLGPGEANDFSLNQQEALKRKYEQTVGVIQIAGLLITGLSLFVGAIGITNIMFVSVKERTKEIGIRKAVGAKRRSILFQFLLESSIICLIGGMTGLFLAGAFSLALSQFLPVSFQFDAAILAIVISLITGIISGIVPSYQAAKLDPVEALRYE